MPLWVKGDLRKVLAICGLGTLIGGILGWISYVEDDQEQ